MSQVVLKDEVLEPELDQKTAAMMQELELAKQTVGNMQFFLLSLASYFKEQNLDFGDFWRYSGAKVADSWQDMADDGAKVLGDAFATNFESLGVANIRVNGDEDACRLLVDDWPSEKTLSEFGLSWDDMDKQIESFRTIAESLSYNLHFDRQGRQFKIDIIKKS